ncbi:MAG: UDP-N-acetylenolpyruvoylglucosamine reductase, partial [Bacteroidota bacterium]|nr:UDP-N-acetylenolpyruvoylglucosamine reductase [Bacteroidota bacterium]
RDAVISIRTRKLPDPQFMGNAGSFFKNPAIDAAKYERLYESFPGIVAFGLPDGCYKLAAGWLIEQCGWKGYRKGDAGVHEQQALVLVNYGMATGAEILALAHDIQASVKSRFDVELEMEVNVI